MTNLQVCYKCVRKAGGNTDMETVRCPRDGKDVAIAARAGVCPLHKFSPAKKTDISISISITTPKSIVPDIIKRNETTNQTKGCGCSRK